MNTLESIKNRKSVRTYLTTEVEEEKLTTIVAAANQAPIAGSIGLTVITNPDILRAVAETATGVMLGSGNDFLINRASAPDYNPIYNAPAIIVVTIPASTDPQAMGINTANAACAAQNMLLAATELGLGSCYTMAPALAFMVPEMKAMIGMTDADTASCVIVLGYTEDMAPHVERDTTENVKFYN